MLCNGLTRTRIVNVYVIDVFKQRVFNIFTIKKLKQSTFVRIMNPHNGQMEWAEREDNDSAREIARSAYADMLHDTERNEKYYMAIKDAISKMHSKGKKANVLDIGTGSGLLAMMAACSGADSVFACEMFDVMADCAKRVIDANGLADKITVICKRSQDLVIGEDMPYKANILVSEVFDTELVGEGAILVFNHAHTNLLEEDSIIIPSKARVFVQVFNSFVLSNCNKMKDIYFRGSNELVINIPHNIQLCPGAPSVHDVQLSELPTSKFLILSTPQLIEELDFGTVTKLKRRLHKQIKILDTARVHGVFMWWDLIMDTDSNIVLSCVPKHARVDSANRGLPWRDHWMQAVYYFPDSFCAKSGDSMTLIASRDEYSWWFELSRISPAYNLIYKKQEQCACTLHHCSRTHIGMINDRSRWKKFKRILTGLIDENSVCICLSEASMLGVVAAKLGAKMVYQLLTGLPLDDAFRQIGLINAPSKLQFVKNVQEIKDKLNESNTAASIIISDPHFMSSFLPIDNLKFWHLKNELKNCLSPDARLIPCEGKMYILPVQFQNLWKIKAPVHETCGFNLKPFDELIQSSINKSDDKLDAQPLWEYPCYALSHSKECVSFDFTTYKFQPAIQDKISFDIRGTCNGIVVWMEWILNEERTERISTGATRQVIPGHRVKWDMFSKQGVHFVCPSIDVTPLSHYLEYHILWQSESKTFHYDFEIHQKTNDTS